MMANDPTCTSPSAGIARMRTYTEHGGSLSELLESLPAESSRDMYWVSNDGQLMYTDANGDDHSVNQGTTSLHQAVSGSLPTESLNEPPEADDPSDRFYVPTDQLETEYARYLELAERHGWMPRRFDRWAARRRRELYRQHLAARQASEQRDSAWRTQMHAQAREYRLPPAEEVEVYRQSVAEAAATVSESLNKELDRRTAELIKELKLTPVEVFDIIYAYATASTLVKELKLTPVEVFDIIYAYATASTSVDAPERVRFLDLSGDTHAANDQT